MPLLSLTLSGANGKPHDWTHVSTPFTEVQTLLNTTGLDTTNVQENGLVPADIRTNANIDAVRIKVRNATGGSLSAGTLVYFSGTYSDGTTNYPKVAKAVSHATASSNYFAQGLLVATTANGADGTAAVFYELSGIDTSSTSVGDLIYLDTTAGGWTKTRPTGGQYIQVVGTVTVVHASTGRIAFAFGSVPEFLTGGSSGLGASVQTFTVQGASGAAADIYHIADAGEDNADKWKISVADGGIRTWENYTSGSYAAKMTLNSSGALQTSGSITSGGFIIGSASITEAELETIDGVTAGTVAVSKAVVVDSNKDIGTFRNVTIDGTFSDGNYTFDTSGNVSGLGTIASGAITSTGVVTGTGFTIGSAVINEAELETIDGITAGTVVASKAVVVDSNKDIGTFRNITLDGTLSDGNYTFDTSGNVSGLGTVGCGAISSTADLTIFDDQNNADTSLSIGTSATEALKIEVLNGGSDKTAQEIKITSSTASGTANHGKFSFYVDDVEIFDIDDGGIDMASGKTVAVDGTDLTSSSAANAFQTIAVSGQDNVVADSTTDTLTFAAGSNVTLTTTAGSDTVTIAAAAAAAGSSSIVTTGALNSGSITSGFGNIDNGSSTLGTGAATVASLVCTAGATFGGGYDDTGVTISTAGVITADGDITSDGTLFALGDTAASDKAAMGYTTADGLVLTGQGSVRDVTIKNDADVDVITIATGTSRVGIANAVPNTYLSSIAAGLVVGDTSDAEAGIHIASSTTSYGILAFTDTADTATRGGINYFHNLGGKVDQMRFLTAGDDRMVIDSAGLVFIGDAAQSGTRSNANMTQGLTINQEANDNEILALKSSDVAHGVTGKTQTDTYGLFQKFAAAGGLQIGSYTPSNVSMFFQSVVTAVDTTKSTSGVGAFMVQGALKSGTGITALSADANIVAFGLDGGTTRFLFDTEGSGHADVEWTTFDQHDDIALLHDIEATLVPDTFGAAMKYDAAALTKVGILGKDSLHSEKPGTTRGMINFTKLSMLHHGAIRQVHQQLQDVKEFYQDKIAALESRLLRLEA